MGRMKTNLKPPKEKRSSEVPPRTSVVGIAQAEGRFARLLPGLSPRALSCLVRAGHDLFSVPGPVWHRSWPHLAPIEHELVEALTGYDDQELRTTTVQLQSWMQWRRLRENRLVASRQPDYSLSSSFMRWLFEQPGELLLEWAEHHVERWTQDSRKEALFALSRLRPMPLEILFERSRYEASQEALTYAPTTEQLRGDYLVSAVAQYLEGYRHTRIRYSTRTDGLKLSPAEEDRKAAVDELYCQELTIPERVFEQLMALNLSTPSDSSNLERVGQAASQPPAVPSKAGFSLRLVATKATPLVPTGNFKKGLRTIACHTCAYSQTLPNQKGRPTTVPPFCIGCTCESILDWEGDPLKEAPFDWKLEQWQSPETRSRTGFPAKRMLFKLHEEDKARVRAERERERGATIALG